MSAVDPDSSLAHYLNHVINHNRYLQLQGIRSGGPLGSYRAGPHLHHLTGHAANRESGTGEMASRTGRYCTREERHRLGNSAESSGGTKTININQALQEHRRLVVLGDPRKRL